MKMNSTFFKEDIIKLIRNNIKTNKAAADSAADFIEKTAYWMNLDYKELKSLMFSPTLKRSWFVRSDGNCPTCGESVPMYNWLYEPKTLPWKMKCPHCSDLYPKNDFKAYYDSALDDKGVFQHDSGNRELLVNDGGGSFGVDDGNGWYDEEGKRYMFIGAYLAHAQWTELIVNGIFNLSFSYILTGIQDYARRAAILFESVSSFFPDFDFYTQGVMYEKENKSNGYVTYWVNSCYELRYFALAYDQIYDAVKHDDELSKVIGKNIDDFFSYVEDRIFKNALRNSKKIETNPPVTPITRAIIESVLDYEGEKQKILSNIDDIIEKATLVDGLSGEKGLAGYTAISPRAIADLLCLYTNTDPAFTDKILKQHPVLYKTYRFHIDTWYDYSYYPGIGDSSVFALELKKYTALFTIYAPTTTIYYRSKEWFAMKLSECYGEPDFIKTIYLSNENSSIGCFNNDFYIEYPEEYEKQLNKIISKTGPMLSQCSINYKKWRISLLHTGTGQNKCMLALPYDSGANHCHHDALSLHLFAKGVNLTPDFGYPPVNYGGWETKEVNWYRHPAAHNSVVIDGNAHYNLPPGGDGMFYRYPDYGHNLMFASGSFINATYCEAKEYADVDRYERLVALIDITATDSYCLDISRTEGGSKHTKFLRSTYSSLSYKGLQLSSGENYFPEKTIMRNFEADNNPGTGWSVDFNICDENLEKPNGRNIHMKYTGLTADASVSLCESWVDITRMVQISNIRTGNQVVWIPTLMVEKEGPRTQFSGILEPYENTSKITSIEHPDAVLNSDFDEVIKVTHIDGTIDLIIANDPKNNQSIYIPEAKIKTDALLAVVRFENDQLLKATICSASYITINDTHYTPESALSIMEFI